MEECKDQSDNCNIHARTGMIVVSHIKKSRGHSNSGVGNYLVPYFGELLQSRSAR